MKGNEMATIDPGMVAVLSGDIEYDLEQAVIPIDDLLELLRSAKEEGATHVVASSGNYRGAQWQRVSNGMYGWADES